MTKPSLPPPLDEQLCFALYGASMAVGRIYKPLLDGLGITYPQYLVLSALWDTDEQTVGAIAERLLLEPSTVTPLVKRLTAAGLAERQRNPDDERQVIVRLTQTGRNMQESCSCLAERLVETSGRDLEDLKRLNGEIRALRDTLGRVLQTER
ncbi:MarR family winged helix-turn-helix transcriptional regulator [Aureimonas psammosilenae]|uniref:MarR family winged helix-turn-helix transcriptional regulator n=1 Tax=Aureimonas psammosilenae TaxID=2495496 RepID=UPI0012606633|nr:MarR family transcriptional regulator [Aureimonas psammosilenae]